MRDKTLRGAITRLLEDMLGIAVLCALSVGVLVMLEVLVKALGR